MTEMKEFMQFSYPTDRITKGKTHGVGPFKEWAQGILDSTRTGIRDAKRTGSFGILSNVQFQRYYQLLDGETLDHFVDRLRVNAREMDASWSFCTYVSLVNVRTEDTPEPAWDGSNLENVISSIVSGYVTPAVVWSAHMRPSGVRETFRSNPSRQGVIFTARDNEYKDSPDGSDIFKHVLL
jgi:hypothetical protein